MTLGISSFVHSSFSSVSDAHSFMTKLKNAILASSANWELSTAVRGVNGITENSSYIKTTFSVHNTVTGEYVRFWYGSVYFEYPATDTANTKYNNFQISRKNIESVGASSNKDYPQQTFLFCGVSDSSLGEDPGIELSLKTPIFSFSGKSITYHSTSSSFINPHSSYRYKWVTTSDGSGFTIICHSNNSGSANNATGMIYHPNLFITRTGDTHTAGSFSLNNSNQDVTFYNSAINGGQLTYYNSLGSADYEHNKSWISMTDICQTSASATSIPCMPVACYTYPPTYEGSDSVLVKDGIGFKGYTNMTVIRTTYPSLVTIGVAYANSSWLCIGEGFLIPWLPEHDADSPFVLE